MNTLCSHLVSSADVKMLQSALLRIEAIQARKPGKPEKPRRRKAKKNINFFMDAFSYSRSRLFTCPR